MKNVSRNGWVRIPEPELSQTVYIFDQSDAVISVYFSDNDGEFEVHSTDTGGHENDQRFHYNGTFQNTKSEVNTILARAEKVEHFKAKSQFSWVA